MDRQITKSLIEWAKNPSRKPLILNGARQIGKSWIVRHLGETHFGGKFCEINFEKTPKMASIFELDLDAKRIIQELEIQFNTQFDHTTLLFFDEIQNCPKAIMALRYFFEDLQEIPIIAAGSLLEFQLQNIPFPVGRVQQLNMFPMGFKEFLMAQGNIALLKKWTEPIQELSATIEEKMYQELLNYFWVGGMPECVLHFANNKDYKAVRKMQQDLFYTYTQDFSKYQPIVAKDCLLDILNKIPNLINNQIIYSKLSDRFTGPTIKKGVDVLTMAKIIQPINNVSVAGLPFTKSGKQFKLMFLDIGLLLCTNGVPFENLFAQKNLNTLFSGAWAEQFVAQELLCNHSKVLNYWARSKKNSNAEVDYIIENHGEIVPIEVKFGVSGKLKSLHLLLKEHPQIEHAIVFSKAKFGIEDKLRFIPIYYAGKTI
jgi:predicted AAA+ superfamily ATPase